MEIYYNLEKSKSQTAVALGFFDGVHLAHKKIISKTVEYSKKDLSPCVLTFSQSPKSIVENIKLDLITTNEQKLKIMKNMGIQSVYMLNFIDICKMSPEDFVTKILNDTLNAKAVFCGFNYRFGRGRVADTEDLKRICKNFNIEVFVEPAVMYGDIPISSTRIRRAIEDKNFELVKSMITKK